MCFGRGMVGACVFFVIFAIVYFLLRCKVMKSIWMLICLAGLAAGCGARRVYAPPFEEGLTVVPATGEAGAGTTAGATVARDGEGTGEERLVVRREERVTMTHGSVLHRFNVIVGSFEREENAVALRERLTGEGRECVIMRNEAGMYRVSIAGFEEEVAAREELSRVRRDRPEFADAWLLVSR